MRESTLLFQQRSPTKRKKKEEEEKLERGKMQKKNLKMGIDE
jgi:hypothetical protein